MVPSTPGFVPLQLRVLLPSGVKRNSSGWVDTPTHPLWPYVRQLHLATSKAIGLFCEDGAHMIPTMSSIVFECQGSLLLDIACVPSLAEALIALPSRLLALPFLHSPQLQGLITRNSLDIHLRTYRLVRLDPTISAAILVTMLTDRGLMVERLTRPDVVHASLEEQALGVVPIGSNTSAEVLVSGSLGLPPVIRMVLPSSGGEASRISLVSVDNKLSA